MRTGGLLLALAACACTPPAADRQPLPPGNGTRQQDDSARVLLGPADRRILTLAGGERRRVASLLRVRGPLRYGEFRWDERGVPTAPPWIRIDLDAQTLSVFRGPHEIGTGVILYGADGHPTPRGRFPVLAKLKDHRSSLYDAEMPYTLRLTPDGIAIHGSAVRRDAATHGCIGVPERFAALIFETIEPGDPVYVEPVPAGST
jgi:hypothetical protein